MTISAQIFEMTPSELAPVLIASLVRLGQQGPEGSKALIDEMKRDQDTFEELLRGDIQEALTWLADDVASGMEFLIPQKN